jgi:3-hydroxyisobutyrate dehydrogenase
VSRETVAVLGLGAMGQGIARRLAETGHPVRAWNRTPDRSRLDHPGITSFDSAKEAISGAPYVLLVLADDAALEQVLAELVGQVTDDQLLLNLGTVTAGTIRRLAEGLPLLDAGMLGNAMQARSGDLRFYLGGEDKLVGRAQEFLAVIGKEVRHVGPLGTGMNLKLALNLLMGLEMQALAEVVALGEGLGIPRSELLEIACGGGFGAPVMKFKSARMMAGRYLEPDFRLSLMAKDLRLAVQAAAENRRDLPMAAAASAAHDRACGNGWADLDCAAIADALNGGQP